MLDLLITGGLIIDGSGADAYPADVAVKDGKICAIGSLEGREAARTIDATGKSVVPGFIDSHSHADCMAVQYPDLESLTVQGVTTVCTGHCGMGIAPVHDYYLAMFNDDEAVARVLPPLFAGERPGHAPVLEAAPLRAAYREAYGVDLDWSTWGEYAAHLEKTGIGVNMVSLVGHGPIRVQAMGTDYRRAATGAEVEAMCLMLRQSLEEGAWGLSFGFDYSPGDYADSAEVEALASVVAGQGSMITAHVQHSGRRRGKIQEGFQPHQGYRELLELGLKTGARVHISHIRPGFNGMPDPCLIDEACRYVLRLIEEYRQKGVRVTWDVLPHYADATFFTPMFISKLEHYVEQCGGITPFQRLLGNPEYRMRLRLELTEGINPGSRGMGGINLKSPGWDSFREIIKCENPAYLSKTLRELAAEQGKEPVDMLLDLLAEDPYTCGRIRLSSKSRLGLDFYANHPEASIGLDVGAGNYGRCNREARPDRIPKYTAAYTEFSGMVHMLCSGVISRREELIAAVSGRTAAKLGLSDRGLVREGMKADLVVMDWDTLDPNVDYITPDRPPRGIDYVFVNGKLAAQHGQPVNARAGVIIRK